MKKIWTTENFEEMSWHDCAVHGLLIAEAEEPGCGELTFQVDYILEWLNSSSGNYEFRIVPVELVFHSVFNLKVEINYESVSAAIQPFSIGEIKRETTIQNGIDLTLWSLEIDWPAGLIQFTSSGFTQTEIGNSIVSKGQFLSKLERENLIA
jgi:hypothetical protein